jgi:hypothetical protein
MGPCLLWSSSTAVRVPSTRNSRRCWTPGRGTSSAVFRRGKWEAMHGAMGGWYEIRLTGPGREQLRLFCLLENGTSDELARRGLPRLAIAVITGLRKPWRTVFSERDYQC